MYALVTGSTSGIGATIAARFLRAGFGVALHGLESPPLPPGRVLHYNCDLRDRAATDRMVAEVERAFGRIDVLVNNAGVQHVAPLEDFSDEAFDRVLDVNLSAAFRLTRAVWPGMRRRRFGRIVNIASVHGLRASEYKAAYVAAKHGLIGLTKTAALEGAPHGITANALCPGYVRTPLVERQIAAQAAAHDLPPERVVAEVMLRKQAIKEFVPADAVADLALLLAGAAMSATTGAVLTLDGGWTAQ